MFVTFIFITLTVKEIIVIMYVLIFNSNTNLNNISVYNIINPTTDMIKMLTEPKTKSTNDEQQSSFYKAAMKFTQNGN